MKKYIMVVCLFLLIATSITGCNNEEISMVEAAPISTSTPTSTSTTEPTPTLTPAATPTKTANPTKTSTPTPLPYTECPENGEGMICFGDYYNELPRTAWDNVDIVPKYIILHWDGRPAKPYDKWLSESTWHGLAGRVDGGKSAHFAVGLDGIGQFLPMYETFVKQSRAASYYMDPHCINIEISGTDFDVIVTGDADEEMLSAIEEVTNLTLDLVVRLMNQYDIPIANILGHYQVLEGKIDPGELWLQEYFLPQLRDRLEK